MTKSSNILWQSGTSVVTTTSVRTRRMTISLADIDLVEVRRPLLAGSALLASCGTFLGLRFADVLLPIEFASLLGIGWLGVGAALAIARLTLHSYSIDGIAMTLPIWRAWAMRQAIDEALMKRKQMPPRQKRRTT
ncbi:MAG: hypothetical protein KJ622_00890 [Alphaproteobacteria bacterium]|nr:hypothetical protein [Alphaproteobacteria bacterium]